MQLNPIGYWICSKYLKMSNDPSFIASSLFEDIDDLSLSAIYWSDLQPISGQIGIYNSALVMQYEMHVPHLSW